MGLDWDELKRLSIYDITLKGLVTERASGFLNALAQHRINGAVLGGSLASEIPRLPKLYADLVVDVSDGRILHVEFQSTNDARMPWRMLEYYHALSNLHSPGNSAARRQLIQFVVYVGRSKLTMANHISHPDLNLVYECIDIRSLPGLASRLRKSSAVEDRILALLCNQSTNDSEWHGVVDYALIQPSDVANRAILAITVFARLRPVGPGVLERLNMMIQLDVEHDPVFQPVVDNLLETQASKFLANFVKSRSIVLDDAQRNAIGLMGHRQLSFLLDKLFWSESPQNDLDLVIPPQSTLGFNGDD